MARRGLASSFCRARAMRPGCALRRQSSDGASEGGRNGTGAFASALTDAERSFKGLRRRAPQQTYEIPFASMMLAVTSRSGFDALWFGDCAALVKRADASPPSSSAKPSTRRAERDGAAKLAAAHGLTPAAGVNRPEFVAALPPDAADAARAGLQSEVHANRFRQVREVVLGLARSCPERRCPPSSAGDATSSTERVRSARSPFGSTQSHAYPAAATHCDAHQQEQSADTGKPARRTEYHRHGGGRCIDHQVAHC